MAPNQGPPPHFDGTPARFVLPAGTTLTRIHSAGFRATSFNPTVAQSNLSGGRFDAAPDDEYAYLYAAEDDATAISETLLHDLPIDAFGARLLPRIRISGLRISWLETAHDMQLINLRTGTDLAALGQDTWLTGAPAEDYAMTRRWSSAIRSWAPWAEGLTWRSRREPEGFAYVFFADRCHCECLKELSEKLPIPSDDQCLEAGAGHHYVEGILTSYRVALI